ncbi:hypothetical protein ACEWY4_022541 [Coilia grayii]|uniref:Uncharacterized protein n=1 Tax=Coilia grayii TaxID=363190 RepID=A0ABD1J6C5_9TELE
MNNNITRETSFGQDHQSRHRRTIYFSSGDTLEQSDSEEVEDEDPVHKEPFSQSMDTASMSWGEYSWFLGTKIGKKSLRMCDFLGEKFARLLGLHAAKYQYAIDEFRRSQKKRKDIEEESSDMDDHAEDFNLSLRTRRNYGATNSDDLPSPPQSSSSVPISVKHIAADNKGYQEDDQ